jgi:hypothetical protein
MMVAPPQYEANSVSKSYKDFFNFQGPNQSILSDNFSKMSVG